MLKLRATKFENVYDYIQFPRKMKPTKTDSRGNRKST